MRVACYLIFPVMVGLCAMSEPLVRLLLTDKWLPVVPLLQILCIAYMWDPVMKINHNMLNVKGRSDYFLYAEIIKKIVAFTILFVTIPYGVKVMCAGLVLYAFADMVIIIYYTRKLTGIGLLKQLKELMPVILLTYSMGAIAYAVTFWEVRPYIQLILGGMAGLVYYISVSFLFRYKEISLLRGLIGR